MDNKHAYKQWENRKPQYEEFGFSEEDIPKIRKAEERFENLSDFVPSDELELLRKKETELYEEAAHLRTKDLPKKKDLGHLETALEFIILLGIMAAIITKGFTFFSWEAVGYAFLLAILFSIPGLLIIAMVIHKPLDSLINTEFFEAEKRIKEQEAKLENQKKEIREQIITLEAKERERHRRYIQTVFGEAYALSDNLKRYNAALNYYNNCRDSRHAEYWDKFQGGNGHEFEKACARFLDRKGFLTMVTRIGPDQGVDIYASRDGLQYACQCKALGGKVSSGDVQKLIGVLVTGPYEAGFFFSLNGFSENALQIAKSSPKTIHCLSKRELMNGTIS